MAVGSPPSGIPWAQGVPLEQRICERWGPYRIQPADLPTPASFVSIDLPSVAAWVHVWLDPEVTSNNGVYRIGDTSAEVVQAVGSLRHCYSVRNYWEAGARLPGPWKRLVIGRGGTAPITSLIIVAALTDIPVGAMPDPGVYAGTAYALYRNDSNDPS